MSSTSEISNILAQHGYPLNRIIHLQSMLHRHASNSKLTLMHPLKSHSEAPSQGSKPSLSSLRSVLHSVQSRKDDFDIISPTQSPVLDTDSDAEADSDSESDAGSVASSSSSLFSSTESVSSAATSVASSPCTESPVDSAKKFASLKDRSSRRPTQPPSPVVDHTKKDVTKYIYQGGQTGVMSGGTMLGRSAGTKPSTTASVKTVRANGRAARSNWRSRE